jgi:hypothetical protein
MTCATRRSLTFYDPDNASAQQSVKIVRDAARFPETYLPGYPEYIWRMKPGDEHEYALARELHGRLLAWAVDLEADDLAPVREAAARSGVTVTIGVHERDGRFSRASVFNTLVVIGPDGPALGGRSSYDGATRGGHPG